jgi:[acyl-carrier-protein] S-malonyltransferase
LIGTAILCSGQGAQSSAMFDLLADAPAAEPVFQAAKCALDGTDPRAFVRSASSAATHANKTGQILCCTQAMAAWAVLSDGMKKPVLVAGYSVGELAAWGVVGILDATGVINLAVARAAAMDAATTQPSGLAAIRGLTRSKLDQLCQAHDCFVAIINSADQMLVGGTRIALTLLMAAAVDAGAERTTLLPVAVASHTPMLAAASEVFQRNLSAAPMQPMQPDIRLLSGIDGGTVFDIPTGVAKLARQIRQTVDWAACMDSCLASGVHKVVELGPGAALAHMARDSIPNVDAHSLSDFRSLPAFISWAT